MNYEKSKSLFKMASYYTASVFVSGVCLGSILNDVLYNYLDKKYRKKFEFSHKPEIEIKIFQDEKDKTNGKPTETIRETTRIEEWNRLPETSSID